VILARILTQPRIAQRTELQGKPEPVAVAPSLVDDGKVGAAQCSVADQVGFGNGRSKRFVSCTSVSARRLSMAKCPSWDNGKVTLSIIEPGHAFSVPGATCTTSMWYNDIPNCLIFFDLS